MNSQPDGHFLEADEFQRLRVLSVGRAFEGIARAWIPIIVVVFALNQLKGHFTYWLLLPIAWVVIASRQHAFAGLAHEAAHRILFKNRFANDFVGRWVFAFPIFVSLNRYRALHMEHHRKLGTDGDPDLAIYSRYPLTKKAFRRILYRDLRAKSVFRNLTYFVQLPSFALPKLKGSLKVPAHENEMRAFWVFHFLIVVAAATTGHLLDYVLVWIVPYLTLLQALLRFRGALEHGATRSRTHFLQNTRTVIDNPLALSVFAPLGLNFHLEHHLYPTLPWYRLRRVNELLASSRLGSVAQLTRGYTSGFNELTR